MLAAIKNLREIRERCHDGAPLDPSLSHWLAESLDRFFGHRCHSIDDALGLRQPRGGVPWWLIESMYARDGALRDLAALVAEGAALSIQAREVRRITVRYGASAWRHDRERDEMPARYRGTPRELVWQAFKSGAPMPLGERQLRNILG